MHFRHRQTDGLASWHKREMYILHRALKMQYSCNWLTDFDYISFIEIVHMTSYSTSTDTRFQNRRRRKLSSQGLRLISTVIRVH